MVSKLGGLDLTIPQGAHPPSPLIWTRVGFNIFQKGDALLEACPGGEAFLKERGKPEGKDSIAVDGAQSTQIFWLCASAKIAEAEKLSRGE